ncbi:MAG: PEP-CTERM sorting domain-containing protein, partial [Candidatus Omnitrophica bacterium]|nr:PEP-CTERM sorting domain-containing protein [Candidatus Omnitrophota bacterium]
GTGWAFASTTNRVASETTAPLSGDSYAWTWNGTQSLFIDFGATYDVQSGYFAQALGDGDALNADTIQLFGYNSNVLVASSGILPLNGDFQLLNANFSNIDRLEIRAEEPSWYLVEDITLQRSGNNQNAVPEPASLLLLGGGLLGTLARRKKA